MNEEWWGICRQGIPRCCGLYDVYPRAAYYALRDAFQLDPYAADTDIQTIQTPLRQIQPMGAVLKARGDTAKLESDLMSKCAFPACAWNSRPTARVAKTSARPPSKSPRSPSPHSWASITCSPSMSTSRPSPRESVQGRLSVNVLGNVPVNPIDEIFYENRGRPQSLIDDDGNVVRIQSLRASEVYQAEITWDDRWFMMDAFYRTGHLHWQYEGDFFGLYRDAFYGENIDIYNGMAPSGFEIAGKKSLARSNPGLRSPTLVGLQSSCLPEVQPQDRGHRLDRRRPA